jgi:hypothetical protein
MDGNRSFTDLVHKSNRDSNAAMSNCSKAVVPVLVNRKVHG